MELIFDKSLTKRPCVYKRVANTLHPVLYFHKAKNAMNEDFEAVVDFLIKRTRKKI